ncbi:hypothetical protein Y5S_01581 [Alcanivorax nanhaiticus]|uniref:DUF600 domain-containing protein n=1 Tax=Alcanivorax nanhaiticus TaxID=1177154 RepID=A0A095SKS2_9GAMM|nr:hypothetical protein [Alcanivorax nanhaiticus]KGD65147.1 hypothetical protein Y5S_01581 [Alcanivorax nanhaiticus]
MNKLSRLKGAEKYYQEIAEEICIALGCKSWDQACLDFVVYEENVIGSAQVSMELTAKVGDKPCSIKTSSKIYDSGKSLRAFMHECTGDLWTSMSFKIRPDGEISVDFGYEIRSFDPDTDDFYG